MKRLHSYSLLLSIHYLHAYEMGKRIVLAKRGWFVKIQAIDINL